MKDRLLVVAVVVPLLGLLALIGRAEFNLQDGRPWLLPIRGYDPRDLISGHYLRFTYDLHPQPSTCGAPPGDFAALGPPGPVGGWYTPVHPSAQGSPHPFPVLYAERADAVPAYDSRRSIRSASMAPITARTPPTYTSHPNLGGTR